jgi:hypothetical protein
MDFAGQMFLIACIATMTIFGVTLFAVSLIAPGQSPKK